MLENLTHPRNPVLKLLIERRDVLLVPPVGCDPLLGYLMHRPGPDLHLHHFSLRSDNGRVNGPVAVFLRHRNVILEPFGNRQVDRGEDTVGREAFILILGLEDDPHRKQIIDFIERLGPGDHLVIDAV